MLLSNLLPLVSRAAATTNYTQAYSVVPTGDWDGNDGGWSTFAIRVGTPAQYFRVLPSTSGTDTWIPLADQCALNPAGCGVARGVEPFNAAPGSSPASGVPSGVNGTAVDAGDTCTINRSPDCITCTSINGACTNGPCATRQCCGDPKGACQSACQGIGGLCTGQYIGCPCTGPDWNAGSTTVTAAATNPRLADGFLSSSSSTWASTGIQQLPIAQNLGVNGTAHYGSDTVGLGLDPNSGLTLQSNPVAGVGANPFYIGTLGLKATDNNSSLLSQLYKQKMIPSLSYGYTAGAMYQSPPILGSLTLGGFDQARTNQPGTNNLTSNLRANDSNVIVSIGSISISNSLASDGAVTSNTKNLTALVDTTLPYLYLPANICSLFEKAYGIQWNASAQTYMANTSTHQQLVNLSPSVTFILNNNASTPQSINITLPYGAFDLSAGYPIFSQGTSYFPLRRANSSSQVILGRAFMQQAYLFVDYQTSQYTISQASFPSNSNVSNIVTVNHSLNSTNTSSSSSSSTNNNNSNGISKGAIAGIVLGISAALGLLGALAFFIWRSKHPRHVDEISRSSPANNSNGSSEPEPDKEGWNSYSPPPAFQSYRSERQGGPSPTQDPDYRTVSPMDEKTLGSLAGTLNHGRKAGSNTSPISPVEKTYGRVVRNVNPWENSELEDPNSRAAAATPSGVGTNMSSGLASLDEKPLPLTPVQMQELPGSATAKEIYNRKTWEYERGNSNRSNSLSRTAWYGQAPQQGRQYDSQSPVNGGGSIASERNFPPSGRARRQDSKSSLGSSVASRPPHQRQKHIFELQADEPRRSRSDGTRRMDSASKRSATASPTSPRYPPR